MYDYTRADGDAQLQRILMTINEQGHTLVAVSQYEHAYTVFFRRPADGKVKNQPINIDSSYETPWWPVAMCPSVKYVEAHYQQFGTYPEFIVMIKGGILPTTLFFDGEGWFDQDNEYYDVEYWLPWPSPPGVKNV